MLLYGMAYLLSGCMLMTSCQVEDLTSFSKGKGTIALDLSATASFNTETKAVNEGDYKNLDNYTVQILKFGSTDPVKFFTYGEKPASITLDNGAYTMKAFYGSNIDAASRTGFYVEGSEAFNVNGETDKSVSVACLPTYGKVAVEFSEMDTYFSDYYVLYSTSALGSNTAKWAKADTEPWYLKLNKEGETVTATIYLIPKSEYQIKTGTVTKTYTLAPNKAWTLQIAPSYNDKTGKLGIITITIDESTNDIPLDIVVPSEWI